MIELLATGGASRIRHLIAPPSKMAFTGAELSFTFRAIGLALKLLAAMRACQSYHLAKRIYRALSGAVIDRPVIRFKLDAALEANLDH